MNGVNFYKTTTHDYYDYNDHHYNYMDIDEGNNNTSEEDDEDENHKEIDYPSSDSNNNENHEEGYFWSDSDENGLEYDNINHPSPNNNHHSGHVTNDILDHDNDYTNNNNPTATCSVCYQQLITSSLRIDELDRHTSIIIPHNRVYLNPCLKHYICGGCIRQSLLSSTNSVLMGGNGHFPCLGDTNCTNALHQRTTTFLYQLRDFFNDAEWSIIMQVSQNLRKGNHFQTITHHPYLVPLIDNNQVTFEQVYQHMLDLMNHEQSLVKCPICNIYLQKTTDCNAIKHSCDWEVCYQCGLIERRLDPNHWKKCPRYDHDKFWRDRGYCCEEGKCFDEHKICSVVEHKKGLDIMQKIMKSYKIYRFLVSLSVSFQKQLVEKLKVEKRYEDFSKFIELYSQNNYK